MKEFIMQILSYDIYIWLISGIIIALGIGVSVIWYLKKIILSYLASRKQAEADSKSENIVIDIEQDHVLTTDESLDVWNIAQKLLQQIEAEVVIEDVVTNKLEEQERERYSEIEHKEVSVEQTAHDHSNKEEINVNESSSKPAIQQAQTSVEVYNTKTNLEVVNKQKTRFEVLKNEVENLKTRSQRIEYEKKLVEATIDFPDDEYFNTLLWDWYIESGDFKKAQTIYKKLHFLNEFDDKALFKLGIINLELGDVQAAEYLLNRAKDLKPENPKYYQALAEVKYNLEKIDECISLMEKAVDLRPTKFEYIEILGKLYKETNNIQLYYKTLLKMNALEPLNQKVRSELGKLQE